MDEPDIPDVILQRIREVIPHVLGGYQPEPNRNEPMPYRRPDGKDLIDGEDERGFAVTPVPKSTSGTIGSFVGQVSVSPDTLLNDFPAGMDGQTPILRSVSDSTKIYAHATVDGAGVVTARVITAGASVPADDPKTGDFYWELASVTMAAGGADNVPVITVDQIRWGPIEELQRYFREFHIQPSGAYRAIVFNGTLFGSLPTGFSVDNSPFFELTGLANGDKIYAKVTYDGTMPAAGTTSIGTRTIAKAATLPTNNNLTGTRHFQLATVTGLDADNFPIISQTRWGPIDTLRPTQVLPYQMPPPGSDETAQPDYWDLTSTGKGADTNGDPLRPTYDSLQFYTGSGFSRFSVVDGNLRALVRPPILNSMGHTTYVGPESVAVNFAPRREFDISVMSHAGLTVKVMRGTWMGRAEPSVNYINPGTRDAYRTLTVANGNTIYVEFSTNTYYATVLTGASTPSNNEHVGLYYRELATVTIAAGVISINQYLWGPLEYTMRFNDRREFDVEPFINGASAVSVKGGTWMGAKGTGTDPLTRSEYFGLNVVNGDTVYVGYNSYYNALTYYAGATMPADAPENSQFYAKLATVTVTAGVVSVNQYRWGPIEHLPRQNVTYALDDSSSSTAHTDKWYFYAPYNAAGTIRTGYNAVTWTGDRYYQTSSSITIDGVTFYVVTTKVFSRTVTIDSNGSTSYISAEFLKATWKWISDTSV